MKFEAVVNKDYNAVHLPENIVKALKMGRAFIWLPLRGEPRPVGVLLSENGWFRVNNVDFMFNTHKITIYIFNSVILIRQDSRIDCDCYEAPDSPVETGELEYAPVEGTDDFELKPLISPDEVNPL